MLQKPAFRSLVEAMLPPSTGAPSLESPPSHSCHCDCSITSKKKVQIWEKQSEWEHGQNGMKERGSGRLLRGRVSILKRPFQVTNVHPGKFGSAQLLSSVPMF